MEEKKIDSNTIIGFLLIGAILLFMLWQQQPTPEELAVQEEDKIEELANEAALNKAALTTNNANTSTIYFLISQTHLHTCILHFLS